MDRIKALQGRMGDVALKALRTGDDVFDDVQSRLATTWRLSDIIAKHGGGESALDELERAVEEAERFVEEVG